MTGPLQVEIRCRVPHFLRLRFAIAAMLIGWAASLIVSAIPRVEVE